MRANQITMFTSDFKMGVINLVIKRCESKNSKPIKLLAVPSG